MSDKLIFVHGFGVKKDARGMFTDIVSALATDTKFSDLKTILVDLNVVKKDSNDIYLNPLNIQAQILTEVINQEAQDGATISLLCHSQGCLVASLVDLSQIKKIIFIAPPTNNDLEKTINVFKTRPGTVIDLEGESVLLRQDGSRTIVPADYWAHRTTLNYLEKYQAVVATKDLTIILAGQDKTISNESVQKFLPDVKTVIIDGDHNFNDASRQGLIETVKNLL